jgi:hypothetical protein
MVGIDPRGDPMRRSLAALVLTFLALSATAQDGAGEGRRPGDAEGVRALIEVERVLLAGDRGRYEALVGQRADAEERVQRVQHSLDATIRVEEDPPDSARLTLLVDQLHVAVADRESVIAAQRIVVERIGERLQRLELYTEQLAALEARDQHTEGLLSGAWELQLMPTDQAGTATLRQSGAVVTGTYQLEGGWTGSLQGTLVNRKVFLVRIDSRLGKSMELEGYLSADGKRIRGSWLNYELAGGEGATGQWSAQRRTERE